MHIGRVAAAKGKKDKDKESKISVPKRNSFFFSFQFLNNEKSITAPIVEFLSYFFGGAEDHLKNKNYGC